MMDAAQREKADKLWSMAQAVMGLPFCTFKHPAFEEAYRFQPVPWLQATVGKATPHHIMNMLHITRHGELAHRHVDGSNETKSAVWIAEHITKDIEERGPPNVLQFVADNASANILAGKLVRERYPHIIFGGCVAHRLDLLMEDIGKLPWVKEVVND
ncbi:hypothetical protein R1sor_024727 [Riccia sorocarpa]|uniref:DUF659 domain-containing protein n=1 Tax=Riccia sorocarpa TaxID=122646 RepID=A0ABD3GSW7_9MARC